MWLDRLLDKEPAPPPTPPRTFEIVDAERQRAEQEFTAARLAWLAHMTKGNELGRVLELARTRRDALYLEWSGFAEAKHRGGE